MGRATSHATRWGGFCNTVGFEQVSWPQRGAGSVVTVHVVVWDLRCTCSVQLSFMLELWTMEERDLGVSHYWAFARYVSEVKFDV